MDLLPSERTEAAPSSPAIGKRKRVARTRALRLGDLGPAQREALHADAYAIYCSYKVGVDRATFERQYFCDDDGRVVLFYDEAGVLVGFYSVALRSIEHEGREHGVLKGLIHIDRRYDGTREAFLHCILDAVRFKLRAPWRPLAYMGPATPASFRWAASSMPTVYPSWRGVPTPADVDALVRKTARLWGLSFVDEARWLVRCLGASRHPERIKRSRKLQEDPVARFYKKQNPCFEEGTWMIVWIPLDIENLGGALVRRILSNTARQTFRAPLQGA